jgi:hypothetical protein
MITIYAGMYNRRLLEGAYGQLYLNGIRSWQALDPAPEIIIVGEAKYLADDCTQLGLRFVPVQCGDDGVPLMRDYMAAAEAAASYPIRMWACPDVLLFQDLYTSLRYVDQYLKQYVCVGRRYELDIKADLDFTNGTAEALLEKARAANNLEHGVVVSYMAYKDTVWQDMPAFRLDGSAMDNWMVWQAIRQGVPVIDITGTATAIHQKHGRAGTPGPAVAYNKSLLPEDFFFAGAHTASFITHGYQTNPQVVQFENKDLGVRDPLTIGAHPKFGWGTYVMVTGENL